MLALFLASLCLWPSSLHHGAGSPIAPSSTPGNETVLADDKALKALAAWLKMYRSGKVPLHAKVDPRMTLETLQAKDTIAAKESIAVKFGLAPKAGLGNPTWAGDLEVILEAVAKLDSPEAAQGLLEVAAIGMDDLNYTIEMAPFEVRAAGEKWAMKLTSRAARDELAMAARGEMKLDKGRAAAMHAAGIRCYGLLREAGSRPLLEQQLTCPDAVVRMNAVEALGNLGEEEAATALTQALEGEQSPVVLTAIAQALRTLYAKYLPKPGSTAKEAANPAKPDPAAAKAPAPTAPESARLAVRAAIKALGRSTWRADMAILQLLDDFRSAEAVPALIGLLERFRDHPEEIHSGKLSGLLLHRAHELLVAMTGAVYAPTEPEKWRELWERDKDKIEVTQKREPTTPGATVAGGFCGIPVQGTRVLFILDLSGSMESPMQPPGTTAGGAAPANKGPNRLDYAKRELLRAMEAMAPNAYFNIITFNGKPEAKVWNKDMVLANEKNRERFRKYVKDLEANGGTNLWSALEDGLKLKSLVYGDRYETNVDELFLLSDGAPTAGDVIDPIEILRLVKESNRFASLRVNTVFISSPDKQPPMPWMTISPEEMMKRMAEQNGGKFVNL